MDNLTPGFGRGNIGVRNVSNAVAQPVLDNSGEGSILNAVTPMSPNFDPTLQAGPQLGMPSGSPFHPSVHAAASRRGMTLPQPQAQPAQPTPQSAPQAPENPMEAATQPGIQNNPKTPNGEAEIILQALSDRLAHTSKKELSALKMFEKTIDPQGGEPIIPKGVNDPKAVDLTDYQRRTQKAITPQNFGTGDMAEAVAGWKPGEKVAFDSAIMNKDATAIHKMLSSIPDYYKAQMADQIAKVIGNGPHTGKETQEWYKRNDLP